MTALPDQTDFVPKSPQVGFVPSLNCPSVTDFYWGYEISNRVHEINLSVLARGFAVLVVVASLLAAMLMWFMPSVAFGGDVVLGKALGSITCLCIAAMLFRFAARGTRVRVQIDTSTGELREVVSDMFGSTVVLSHYGLDAVKEVSIETSKADSSIGQVQLTLKDGSKMPVGEGAMIGLYPWRNKIAAGKPRNSYKAVHVWTALFRFTRLEWCPPSR